MFVYGDGGVASLYKFAYNPLGKYVHIVQRTTKRLAQVARKKNSNRNLS